MLIEPRTQLVLSAVSTWEIAIKSSLGKLRLPEDPRKVIETWMEDTHVELLSITHDHSLQILRLPPHHRDPFDRMLVAQAQVERLPIMTADGRFARYDIEVLSP